ncbi:hypothetical protein PHISCL_08882 [Aspergillus sclerotialis]|uniref:ubiquitinyl hydrolase 1 n=1 Tax=Aspergillus sclerotialis TaxID=2070753 RepID=A0A3A2ZNW2_9EURO|nr:hypothetical protein PHISCL_08882 [Aspergillus sclerotialis]
MLKSFASKSSPDSKDILEVAISMMENWLSVDFGDSIHEESLARIIGNLETHGAVALYVRAQNCGWLAYHDKEYDAIIFDAFEVSPSSEAVLKAPGPLVRSFPGRSVVVSSAIASDPNFCFYLANSLTRLFSEDVEEMSPKSFRAGTEVCETRDTTHPGLVTEGLMVQLLAFGNHNNWGSFQKRMRDDVNWDRREGYIAYKNFILYLVAHIGVVMARNAVIPEQLANVRSKLGRRIYKLGENTHDFVAECAKSSEEGLMNRLRAIQLKIRRGEQMMVPDIPTAGANDLQTSLKNSREYLISVLRQSPTKTDPVPFNRFHRKRHHRTSYGLPLLQPGDYIELCDFERWVERELNNWVNSIAEPSNTVCCSLLADLFHKYAEIAPTEYKGCPEEVSLMMLTLLELWVAIDSICIAVCPLLKSYQPEIPVGYLEPLLLPQLSQMKRANKVEEYILSRHQNCSRTLPSILADPAPMSFAVRYFDTSDTHRELRKSIEKYAEGKVEQKRQEWDNKSKRYNELKCQASQMEHEVAYNQKGNRHHPSSCAKCHLEKEALRMSIQVYEWPLPKNEDALKSVIFELDCPSWFASWRDATWTLLNDFGGDQEKQPSSMEQDLLVYGDIKAFVVNKNQRLSLSSKTKSWRRSHYSSKCFPINFEKISVPNGFQFKLRDKLDDVWVVGQHDFPSLKPRSTLLLPDGPYSSLQYAVSTFSHTENKVIADQRNCHPKISLHEFIAFGCLRAGERTQWHNIVRELASSALSMNEESVSILFRQAAWEFGSHNESSELREAHQVFEDVAFVDRLIDTLEARLREIESNWNEYHTLHILIILALRVCSLSYGLPAAERSTSFLRKSRLVAMRWCQSLVADLDTRTGSESVAQRMLVLKVGEICQLSYYVDLQHLPALLHSHEDLMCLTWSSMIMFDNTPKLESDVSLEMKRILRRMRKLNHHVEEQVRQLIQKDASGLNSAIEMIAPSVQISSPWCFYDGSLRTRWATSRTHTSQQRHQQEVHYDILSGELLVDNSPPGRLSAAYTSHPLFRRLFGLRILRVVPSNLPGSEFMSVQPFGEFQVHFGIKGSQVVLKAQSKERLFQLIPHDRLSDDFPSALVTDYVHWLDLHYGILEFRPLMQPWQPSLMRNWNLSFDPNCPEQSVMRRGRRILLDVHGPVFTQMASVLNVLDDPKHIHAIQIKRGITEIDMVRLHLRFLVNNGVLESQEHNAIVDQNQDLGCLFGLDNKLVLVDTSRNGCRTVLVPYGRVVVEKTSQHTKTSIILPEETRIKYFSYTLDPHLHTLHDSSGILGALYLAYLHAVTGFVLPDPATHRPGTDEALRILRQARMKTSVPLDSDGTALLEEIASLTPRRKYYPSHLKVMQTTRWDRCLGEMAQHDDFELVVQEIISYNQQFSEFYNVAGVKSVDFTHKPGNEHLLKRARSRNAHFQYSEFGGCIGCPAVQLTEYAARDRGLSTGNRSRRVYEIAALVRDWAASIPQTQDLVSLVEGWDYIHTCGPDLWEDTYTHLLRLPIERAWGALYDFCRKSDRENDMYKLVLLFCTLAFGDKIQLQYIKPLLAVAFSGQFQGLSVPGNRGSNTNSILPLKEGKELDRSRIRSAILNHYAPFERSGYTVTGSYSSSEYARNRRRYERKKERNVDSCLDIISKQWPCERPEIPQGSVTGLLNRNAIIYDCGKLFTCWNRNRLFFIFLKQVQDRINAMPLNGTPSRIAEPMPLPLDSGLIRYDVPFKPPTLVELIRSSKSPFVPPASAPVKCYRNSVLQDSCMNRNLELRNLIRGSLESPNIDYQEYKRDLLECLNALEKSQIPSHPTEIPLTREILINHQSDLISLRDLAWSSIASALTNTKDTWRDVGGKTFWPLITVSGILSLLAVDKWADIPEHWKKAILTFAKILSSLRRCERLLACFDKMDINGFFKEAETAGCEGWDGSTCPDWLLFEVENNLTIRPQQAEVAWRMIDPVPERNSVLQLNMGEGKTSVITPLVVSRLTDRAHIPRIIVLKPLLRQSIDLLAQRLGGLLNRLIYYFPFSRNTPMDKASVDQLQKIYHDCQRKRGILITLPEQILSFRLVGLDKINECVDTAEKLIRLERWLQSNCRNIVDESDEVFDPKFQLVYTVGNQHSMDGQSDRWGIIQAVLAVVERQALKLHSQDQKLLDIECNGARYPIIHFLKMDAVDVLLESVFQTISHDGLPGLPFNQWPTSVRERAQLFIHCVHLPDEDQSTFQSTFGTIFMCKLLVLRGLFAHGILRFSLASKRWLVDYGLHHMRCLIAVPFRAKGIPSENSEFGHPDVALTLTCLSYYYDGLSQDQVRHCFSLLIKENDAAAEYQNWIAKHYDDLPSGLRSFAGVNLEDKLTFSKHLYPHLKYQKGIIDFYLSHVVFPREAKEFPRKLSTSAWDLPSRPDLPPTTGFSGTNDNRSLLPRSIPQRDLPHLRHTNALVLSQLLLEENRQCVKAQDCHGCHLRTDDLIQLINYQRPPISVIIDVGAQILERDNQSFAENWLSMVPEERADAALFYDKYDEPMVVDREGYAERLPASPFRRRMERCVIFLDQHHARGVDLKLPLNYRAAVILGPRLTKDRLVQACNRMRELGNGQSVMFVIPPEVSQTITSTSGQFTSSDVIKWTLRQTCDNLENFRPLWAWHGIHYRRRARLWDSLLTKDKVSRDIAYLMQEPEAQTLIQLYAPWESTSWLPELDDTDWSDLDVQELMKIWQNSITNGTGGCRFHEEQERQIAVEVQREQQVCRPGAVTARRHNVHQNIEYFVKHGRFPNVVSSSAICRAFNSLRWTSADELGFHSTLGPYLYATFDFTETVAKIGDFKDDEFLKSVHWIMSNIHNPNLLILSQFEVNQLLPEIQKSENTALHIYTPRTTKGMRSFNHLDFLTIGSRKTKIPPSPELGRDLELFAGSLYFDTFADYQRFRQFLGLITNGFSNIPDGSVSPEGFVDERTRTELQWPVHSPFQTNPLPFLIAILNMRARGHGYLQTHVGSIVGGTPIMKDQF